MVDTLLWGGSGSNPVRVRVSPTALHFTWGSFRWSFLFFLVHCGNVGCITGTKGKMDHWSTWKQFRVLHLSNFYQVENMLNLYLFDKQMIAFSERSWPAEKTAGGEHGVWIFRFSKVLMLCSSATGIAGSLLRWYILRAFNEVSGTTVKVYL